MATCWFVLLRFFLRVDGVLLRLRETRIFHEFDTEHIIREYTEKEIKWSEIPTCFGETNCLGTECSTKVAVPMTIRTADAAAKLFRSIPHTYTSYKKMFLSSVSTFDMNEIIEISAESCKKNPENPKNPKNSENPENPKNSDRILVKKIFTKYPGCCFPCNDTKNVQLFGEYIEDIKMYSMSNGKMKNHFIACANLHGVIVYQVNDSDSNVVGCIGKGDHDGSVLSVSFFKGGSLLSSGEDGCAKIWSTNPSNNKNLNCIRCDSLSGVSADYTTSLITGKRMPCAQLVICVPGEMDRYIVAVGRTIHLLSLKYQTKDRNKSHKLPAVQSSITAMHCDAKSSTLLAVCYGGVTIYSDYGSGNITYLRYKGPLLNIGIVPGGCTNFFLKYFSKIHVASGCSDGLLHLWQASETNISQAKTIVHWDDYTFGGYDEKVKFVDWSTCGRYMCSAGGKHVIVWDFQCSSTHTHKIPAKINYASAILVGHKDRVTALSFAPRVFSLSNDVTTSSTYDDQFVLVASADEKGCVFIHKITPFIKTKESRSLAKKGTVSENIIHPITSINCSESLEEGVTTLMWSSCGNSIYVGTDEGQVIGLDVQGITKK